MAPVYFIVDIDDGSGPRKQTRRRGFATRRPAQAALSTTLHDLSRKTYVAPSRQTLAVFAQQEWLPAIEPTGPAEHVRQLRPQHPPQCRRARDRTYVAAAGGRTPTQPVLCWSPRRPGTN